MDVDLLPGLTELPAATLLATYQAILQELHRREIVRTDNAPTGDYAEYLAARLYRGTLAPNSEKSWDVRTPDGQRLQVKARVVRNPGNAGERQLSVFRSFDFDRTIIILFAADYSIWRAVSLPAETVQRLSKYRHHVNGHVLFAKDAVLDDPSSTDLTQELRLVSLAATTAA